MSEWIGYRWLAAVFNIQTVNALPTESLIGASRRTYQTAEMTREVYTAAMRPDATVSAHLTFALKHEGIHLEFLSRLFEVMPESEISTWVNSERTGQYARRAGFLWEWLKGRELQDVTAVTGGNYIDALNPEMYLVSTESRNNIRWRVRDNLPGTSEFCPVVRLTTLVTKAKTYDCAANIEALQLEYGADILMRSATWLTIKESRASFLIEHEEDKKDRVKRFAAVMERHCGELDNPLDRKALSDLQSEVLGNKTTFMRFGVRTSPVFIGGRSGYHEETVHYVAPPWGAIDGMLHGLESYLARTKGASSIARSAVASFGFVYIHPLADGNGRIHRFLINDVLRRDDAVPKPFILPISATITNKAQNRALYEATLELFSKPFMSRYSDDCVFRQDMDLYDDGIKSNFVFTAYQDAMPAWRYLDLTRHVEYLANLIDDTIRLEMRNEARLLRSWDKARNAVKDIVEGPDRDIDRIIRSIQGNNGQISNKLMSEFVVLTDKTIAEDIVMVINAAFSDNAPDSPLPAIL